MFWNNLLNGTSEGLIWALLAVGVYLSFRVLDFADLTVEGSFTCGAAVSCVLIVKNGYDPFLAAFIAFLAGAVAGMVTGLLHTKFRIAPILAGILTMIGLYSVNLMIMGSPSIAVDPISMSTILTKVAGILHIARKYVVFLCASLSVLIVCAALYWFFGTEYGSAVRATGTNEKMSRAQGINTDRTKIVGLMLSNALVALSGAIYAQYNSSADIQMGIGSIVIGLASVIIGETIFFKARSFSVKLLGVVVGSIVYRVIITFVVSAEAIAPGNLKLFTAIIVAIALALPVIKAWLYTAHKRLMQYPWYKRSLGGFFAEIGLFFKQRRNKKKALAPVAAAAAIPAVQVDDDFAEDALGGVNVNAVLEDKETPSEENDTRDAEKGDGNA